MNEFLQMWFAGWEDGLCCLAPHERQKMLCACAERCAPLAMYNRIFEDVQGDPDAFFEALHRLDCVSGQVIEPGKRYAVVYPECLCDLHTNGWVNAPQLCECSRQSMRHVLKTLWPARDWIVTLRGTVLGGEKQCLLEIEARQLSALTPCSRKLLLTSAGFQNTRIRDVFLNFAGREPAALRVLLITTAAVSPDAVEMLPVCLHDVLDCGIPKQNVTVYDLHDEMSAEALATYDAVYVCGGDTRYLLRRVNECGFADTLRAYVDNGGVYVGVSAGSLMTAQNLADNLGFVNAYLSVHCECGSDDGALDTSACPRIALTDRQMLLLTDGVWRVFS